MKAPLGKHLCLSSKQLYYFGDLILLPNIHCNVCPSSTPHLLQQFLLALQAAAELLLPAQTACQFKRLSIKLL